MSNILGHFARQANKEDEEAYHAPLGEDPSLKNFVVLGKRVLELEKSEPTTSVAMNPREKLVTRKDTRVVDFETGGNASVSANAAVAAGQSKVGGHMGHKETAGEREFRVFVQWALEETSYKPLDANTCTKHSFYVYQVVYGISIDYIVNVSWGGSTSFTSVAANVRANPVAGGGGVTFAAGHARAR